MRKIMIMTVVAAFAVAPMISTAAQAAEKAPVKSEGTVKPADGKTAPDAGADKAKSKK